MFEKFGEMGSYEEVNLAAEGLKKEGDKESLYALAEENGVDKEDAEDYLLGGEESLHDIVCHADALHLLCQHRVGKSCESVLLLDQGRNAFGGGLLEQGCAGKSAYAYGDVRLELVDEPGRHPLAL